MFEQTISVDRLEQAVSLFGSFDENIRLIEREYGVSVISRGSDLKVTGEAENVSKAVRAIGGLLTLITAAKRSASKTCGMFSPWWRKAARIKFTPSRRTASASPRAANP